MKLKHLSALAVISSLALSGCDDGKSTDEAPANANRSQAVYLPSTGNIPFPHDIFFVVAPNCRVTAPNATTAERFTDLTDRARFNNPNNFENDIGLPSRLDGTLNIRIADRLTPLSDGSNRVTVELNTMDGFGTLSVANASMSGPIDPATITANSVRLVKVISQTLTPGATPPGFRVLASASPGAQPQLGVDYQVSVSATDNTRLVIEPLRPLDPASTYAVFVTNGLASTDGRNFGRAELYDLASQSTSFLTPTGASARPDLLRQFCHPASAAGDNSDAATMELLRNQIVGIPNTPLIGLHGVGAQIGLNPNDIIVSWSFSTQSVSTPMENIARNTKPKVAEIQPLRRVPLNPACDLPGQQAGTRTDNNTCDLLGTSPLTGFADLYEGLTAVRYFLEVTNPAFGFWRAAPNAVGSTQLTAANPVPVVSATNQGLPIAIDGDGPVDGNNATEEIPIPVLMSVPNAKTGRTKPAAGWPVVIFQHGVTANRTNMLALADNFARQGYIVIAIDQPLHGIVDGDLGTMFEQNPLRNPRGAPERHFFALGVDLSNPPNMRPGPSGGDGGGVTFNPLSFRTARDNFRQAASDIIQLAQSIPTIQFDAINDGTPDFDRNQVHFVGHSLGGFVGSIALGANSLALASCANDPNCNSNDIVPIRASALANSGAHLSRTILGSQQFGVPIIRGLGQAGIVQGTPTFDDFLRSFQTVVEAADPFNYAVATAGTRPMHLIGIAGDPANGVPADTAVPIEATRLLAEGLGVPRVSSTQINPNGADPMGASGLVEFTAGNHGTVLSPGANNINLAITTEMQLEMISFITTKALPNPMPPPPAIPVPNGGAILPVCDTNAYDALDGTIDGNFGVFPPCAAAGTAGSFIRP